MPAAGAKENPMVSSAIDREVYDIAVDDQFDIYFQPIVTTFQHRIVGFEALMKLKKEGLYIKNPDDIFHHRDTVSGETMQLIDMACMKKALLLGSKIPGDAMLFINVNGPTVASFLSEFRKKRKSQSLEDAMALSANRIVLEINENTDPVNVKLIIKLLEPFRKNGMSIAIDDIGIRYPWLNHYTWLRPEYVKLDRFFLKNALKWKTHKRVIEGICDMMRMLDTMMIGEGIETDEEIEFSRTLGMDYLQGFKFSKAMPVKYWQEHIK